MLSNKLGSSSSKHPDLTITDQAQVLLFASHFVRTFCMGCCCFLSWSVFSVLHVILSICPFGLNSDDVQHQCLRTRISRIHRQIKGKPVLLAGLLQGP